MTSKLKLFDKTIKLQNGKLQDLVSLDIKVPKSSWPVCLRAGDAVAADQSMFDLPRSRKCDVEQVREARRADGATEYPPCEVSPHRHTNIRPDNFVTSGNHPPRNKIKSRSGNEISAVQ